MIEQLTKEQTDKFPHYIRKWIDIGTNTDRLNYDRTVDIINDFQTEILGKDKSPVVIVNNPIEAWIGCCLIYMKKANANNLVEKIAEYFEKGNPEGIEVNDISVPYQTGSFFSPVFSFYDFFFSEFSIQELGVTQEIKKKYDIWQKTVELGMIYPMGEVCIVTQKPTVIKLNENNVLHCDGGTALEYDGYGDIKIYSLNGVMVSEELAVTPSGNLNIDLFLKESNADIKAQFILKYGVERMLHLGVMVDTFKNYDEEWWTKSEYELWDMHSLFTFKNYAPYLKMLNQTTGIWHVEGVSPNCKTLREAIRERFNGMDFSIKTIK